MTSSYFSDSNWSFANSPDVWNTKIDFGKKGGGMAFDPVTLGLGIANIGAGIFGGMSANRTQANIANAQMAAAADQLKWNVLQGRDIAKFGEAGNIAARIAQGTWMPDLEFGRQREAEMFKAGPLGERQLALGVEGKRREFGLARSEDARAISQAENREALKRSLAERQGQMMGMFGRIAPVDTSTLFV